MSEALQWLSSCLEEVADDREVEPDEENIPLLPLTEDTFTAMDNPQFQEMLKALGVIPPFEEQVNLINCKLCSVFDLLNKNSKAPNTGNTS